LGQENSQKILLAMMVASYGEIFFAMIATKLKR